LSAARHHYPVLTRLYIEALLLDPEAAAQVWEAWSKGELSDYWAVWARCVISLQGSGRRGLRAK